MIVGGKLGMRACDPAVSGFKSAVGMKRNWEFERVFGRTAMDDEIRYDAVKMPDAKLVIRYFPSLRAAILQ